ncbi:MAG TPA: DUF4340 domain-containing protein [Pirellulales bacterium]|nr:DUF4340 domain-containing protein [Pirellulales bacterium]
MQDQENRRTIVYLLVAGMALLVAWEPWYRLPTDESAPVEVGKKLFPDFSDPLAAKSLEIIKFDEDTATIRPFKVAQANGVWSIPSHSNYPADAREHMAEAATSLLDIEILGVASSSPGDQELYGVIAPDPQKLRQGATGVGTRITLKDGKEKVLADLIVGKEVKDQPTLRYVRRADRDQICPVKIKTDKLSTKFEDWIEKDLLKLNAFDVHGVELNDYSIDEVATPDGRVALSIHPRSRMKLDYDDAKSSWNMAEITEFTDKGKPEAAKLADDEELNTEKLNGLKTALDDLQIVDVERKPKGLSQDLRASEEFVKDNEAKASLITRGFYPVPSGDHIEIYSSQGEATCTTKDGVRYVLRFGQLAGGEDNKDDAKPGEKEKRNPALNRYLFVRTQFDETQIPKPKFEPVPGADKPAAPAAEPQGEAPPATDKPDGEKPADAKPENAAPQDKTGDKPDAKATDKPNAGAKVPQKKTALQETDAEAPAAAAKGDVPAAKGKAPATKDDESATDKIAPEKAEADKPEADKADGGKPEAAKTPAAPVTPEEERRIAIEKENKRKQDDYDAAIKKGQDKVQELNDRFADWYFVISDDVYKKIHLSRADVVKKKEPKDKAGAEKAGAENPGAALPGLPTAPPTAAEPAENAAPE